MNNHNIFLTNLLICWWGFATAQQIQITILPGSEYTLSRRDEWKVVVNNTGNQTLKSFFVGIATESQRGKVYEVRSQARDIYPGSSVYSTKYYIGLDPFTTVYEDPYIRQFAIQTNGLPAGDYELCITAYSAVDSAELGSTCYSFTADYFTPPIPVAPDQNDTVCEQFPFFNWLPPVPNKGQNFTYTLTIYELQNMQTVLSSVQTNPAFYERKGITTPIVQYGINARNLRPGYRYAWKVSAEINNKTVATSEVWNFVYCPPQKTTATAAEKEKSEPAKNLPKPGIAYLETKTSIQTNFHITDKGVLNFVYTHRSKSPSVGLRVMDMKGTMAANRKLDVQHGLNYFSVPLQDLGKLTNGELYELQIIDIGGDIQKLLFKPKQ